MTKLLIDIGNTRIKWAYLQDSESCKLTEHGCVQHNKQLGSEVLKQIEAPAKLSAIYVSAVTDDLNSQRIKRQLQDLHDVPVQMIKTQIDSCGVINCYEQPELLGVDRWIAMIGAYSQAQSGHGVVVVDVGTAVTIDVVGSDGKHLGGTIAPGLALMRNSLSQNAQRLMLVEDADINAVADNTQDAIASGTMWSIVGNILQTEQRLGLDQNSNIDYFITGGDAQQLLQYLPSRYQLVNDLILQGLAQIAESD
ncbi:MAG: type III pantothenate kinase [Gammaproteobacteria bacterium]|nr:MAG: type III pantothenate kinase [Gammaproteobacteria bacterium]